MVNLSSSFSLKTFMTVVGVSFSIAQAMDSPSSSPHSHRKRSFDESRRTEEEPSHGQVFARATLDPVAKYVLDDPEVLKGFIQTFARVSGVEILQILDNNLNPLERKYSNLYEAFHKVKPKLRKIMEDDKEGTKDLYKVEKRLTEDASYVKDEGLTTFLYELARHQDDLSKIFPDPKRPQVDVLCKFSQRDENDHVKEELALVEIQVAQQDYWDQRGLAYAALIYGNQLRRSEEWSKLKNVIAINILGGGVNNVKYWQGGKYVRHYQFQDKHDP
ncbi:MAG: Rpn family recombination-promoting nuclease/putative transposase, partial [Candidatus Paracaedibacteraceae bacterium]|nr:Rpn family recombination-promoting nuclease/putative transposase [Candidatus Paracaedibacteraceae bacterium]